jgi:hypothetical protein
LAEKLSARYRELGDNPAWCWLTFAHAYADYRKTLSRQIE